MIYRLAMILVWLSLIFPGCATKRLNTDEQGALTGCTEIMVRQADYGPKGLPMFLNRLAERPGKSGDRFTLVQLTNGRPTKSYDIVVVGPESDFTKPFKVVYEWTGKGFVGGAQVTLSTAEIASHGVRATSNGKEAAIVLAVIIAPMAIGTAGGFVVGVADGIKTTAAEVGKMVDGKREQLVAFATYDYDVRDRLVLMRMYKADDIRQELVRTEYTYKNDASEPQKATYTTFPDGAVRVVE